MRDVRLHASSARARNAVLSALNNLRLPPNLTKVDMVTTFSTTFRIILPDTLDLARHNAPGPRIDECELDALDALLIASSSRRPYSGCFPWSRGLRRGGREAGIAIGTAALVVRTGTTGTVRSDI